MTHLDVIELANVLGQHARRHAAKELNPYRSDVAKVIATDPVTLKMVGRNVRLDMSAVYWGDHVDPFSLLMGDEVTVVAVEHHFLVVGTARLGAQGSTAVTPVSTDTLARGSGTLQFTAAATASVTVLHGMKTQPNAFTANQLGTGGSAPVAIQVASVDGTSAHIIGGFIDGSSYTGAVGFTWIAML